MKRVSDRALIVRVDTGTAELIPDPHLPDAWLLRLNGTAQSHVNLNDPTLIAEGLTAQLSNHDNHLHVRYCEKVHPSSLYDC